MIPTRCKLLRVQCSVDAIESNDDDDHDHHLDDIPIAEFKRIMAKEKLTDV